MFDRYDFNKGRYVRYEYEPKGDRFTRGLSEMPRAYKLMQNSSTGYSYYRRTRTDEAQGIKVKDLERRLPEASRDDLEARTLYITDSEHPLMYFVQIALEPPGIPLQLDVTRQHKGKRLWFLCPYCQRRVGTIYRVPAPRVYLQKWGCRTCLGLTYPSQAGHKTRARDLAIYNGHAEAGLMESVYACYRQNRRYGKLFAMTDKLLSRLAKKY